MAEMRSPQRELPLEIVQAILGTYDAEAFPSFRVNLEDLEDCPPHIAEARTTAFRCSLVSHSFRQHLLPRIFARVTIQSKARLDSFVSLLKSNPQISSHIVGLDLHQLCQDECHRPELEDDFITLANEDPSNLSALFLSLQHSSTLRELSIMFECHPEEPRQAAFSQSTLNEIVKELLMGVPLLSLRLRAIRLPLEVVELIPTSLSYLSVVGVEIDSAESTISESHFPDLRSLNTIEICSISEAPSKYWPARNAHLDPVFPEVEHMVIFLPLHHHWEAVTYQFDQMISLAPKLHSITLNLDLHEHHRGDAVLPLTFSDLCVRGPFDRVEIIRTLGLSPRGRPWQFYLEEFYPEAGFKVGYFLSHETSDICKLQSLTLTFRCDEQTEIEILKKEIRDDTTDMDEVLTQPQFKNLKEVVINVGKFGLDPRLFVDVENRIRREWLWKTQETHGTLIRLTY